MDREVAQILACYPRKQAERLWRAFRGRPTPKMGRFCQKCGWSMAAHVDGCPPRARAYQGDGIWIPSDDRRVRLEYECPGCQAEEFVKLSEAVEGEPLCGHCDRSMRYIGVQIKEPYADDVLATGGNVHAAFKRAELRGLPMGNS